MSHLPTIKIEDEADYEMWEDIENSVKIIVEPTSQMTPYHALSDESERRAAGTSYKEEKKREGEGKRERMIDVD